MYAKSLALSAFGLQTVADKSVPYSKNEKLTVAVLTLLCHYLMIIFYVTQYEKAESSHYISL